MWYAVGNHHVGHIRAKGILGSNFDEAVIDNISFFFTKLPQISKIVNFKIIIGRDRSTASTLYKFLWLGHVKNVLFFYYYWQL